MSWEHVASFRVEGEPKGQPRPRAFARNGKARVYDPGTSEGWKGLVAFAAKGYIPNPPLSGPVKFNVKFLFPRPQRLLRKSSPEDRIMHTAKPDFDNAAKAVADCLTIIGFWTDDAVIACSTIEKYYVAKGELPGATINVFSYREDR